MHSVLRDARADLRKSMSGCIGAAIAGHSAEQEKEAEGPSHCDDRALLTRADGSGQVETASTFVWNRGDPVCRLTFPFVARLKSKHHHKRVVEIGRAHV